MSTVRCALAVALAGIYSQACLQFYRFRLASGLLPAPTTAKLCAADTLELAFTRQREPWSPNGTCAMGWAGTARDQGLPIETQERQCAGQATEQCCILWHGELGLGYLRVDTHMMH